MFFKKTETKKSKIKVIEAGDQVLVKEDIVNASDMGRVEMGNCWFRARSTTGASIMAGKFAEFVRNDGRMVYVKPIV